MPVHRTKSGGYQWGKSGKVYFGAGAKEKAEKQGPWFQGQNEHKERT